MRATPLFLLGFGLAVAFWPGTLEAAFVLRWALLALLPPLLVLLLDLRLPSPLKGWGVALALFPLLSVMWATDGLLAMEEAAHMLILCGIFCLGAIATDLRNAWRGLAVGLAISGLLAVAQRYFGFDLIEQAVPPGGLFINKNVLAEAGMVGVIACAVRRDWLYAAGPALCVVMGNSRAVTGALAVVLALWLWQRDRMIAVYLGLAALACAALSFYSGDPSATARAKFWLDAVQGQTLFGHGAGAFTATFQYAEFAHNEYVQMLYELGPIYTAAFITLLVYLWMEPTHEAERLVIAGIALVALLAFPFHMPLTAAALALCAGHVAAARMVVHSHDGAVGRDHGGADERAATAGARSCC